MNAGHINRRHMYRRMLEHTDITPRHAANRWLSRAAFAGALAVASAAAAFTAGAAELKVGFVNVAKVMESMPQSQAAQTRMEKEFAPRDQQLLEAQRVLRAKEDDLFKNGAALTNLERQSAEREVRQLKRDLQSRQDEFRDDLNLRRSEELSKLQRRVSKVIAAFAKARDFDLVLTNGVVFASERVDITGVVLEQLESEFERNQN
ncbi:MAG: OmpH family outer membrane protein [Gammaproteobacteria bacterium]